MALSNQHRRFLIVDQGAAPALFNFLLNFGIAWAVFRSMPAVPLWGESSIAGDTIVTSFLLPLLTCLIVTPLVRRQAVSGQLLPLGHAASGWLAWLSALSALRRGLVLGVVGVVLAGVPTCFVFASVGPSELSLSAFLWFKAGYAAILAGAITPVIGWSALLAASPAKAA
jgi:hypothetical protein